MDTLERVFFIENEKYSLNDFIDAYGKDTVEELLIQQVASRTNKGTSIVFMFVGITIYKKLLFCILPKYFHLNQLDENQYESIISTLIKVIEKYGSKERDASVDLLIEKANEKYISILPIIDTLLKDFNQFGFLSYYNEVFSLDGEGEIDWQQTTDLSIAYIDGKTPHYFNLYRNERNEELYSVITSIHKLVINECISKFSFILGYNIDINNFDFSIINSLSSIGDKRFLVFALKSRLSSAYNDREIVILRVLLQYIENCYDLGNIDIYFYGTKDFEYIWEDVCKQVFTHTEYKLMPRNVWKSYKHYFTKESKKQKLIPDIILEETYNSKKTLLLADAKYYKVHFDSISHSVQYTPGIGDTTKQLLYQRALTQSKKNIKKFFNVFLFPNYSDENFEIIGEVNVEHPVEKISRNFLRIQPVQLVLVSTEYIYNKYLDGQTLNKNELNDLFNKLVAYKKISKKFNYNKY
jgi:hypothetical protein